MIGTEKKKQAKMKTITIIVVMRKSSRKGTVILGQNLAHFSRAFM